MEAKKSLKLWTNICLHNNISKEILSTWRDAWGHNYVSQFNILAWASQSSWTAFKAAFAFIEMCVKCWKVVSHETVIRYIKKTFVICSVDKYNVNIFRFWCCEICRSLQIKWQHLIFLNSGKNRSRSPDSDSALWKMAWLGWIKSSMLLMT